MDVAEHFAECLRQIYSPMELAASKPGKDDTGLQDGMLEYYNSIAPFADANIERKLIDDFDFRQHR